jgi:hypothetical protein
MRTIVEIAKKTIKEKDLNFKIQSSKRYYLKNSSDFLSENELKKIILNMAFCPEEQSYLFINRVLKQIDLMLL